jgi:hypothetical protein
VTFPIWRVPGRADEKAAALVTAGDQAGSYPVTRFYFVPRCRSAAFAVRALAAAFDALSALARLSSGLILAARARPPIWPSAVPASERRLILRLFVMYFLGVFPPMWKSLHRYVTVKQLKNLLRF